MKIFLLFLAALATASGQSQNYQVLDINQVKAGVTANGSLHYNPSNNNQSSYEVPKGSGRHASNLTGLWIAGKDGSSNLHFSGQTWSTLSSDFWPGPLSTVNATTNASVSAQYDKVWKINKSDIDNFLANRNTPGYVIPQSILQWPGNGDIAQGQDPVMAPYVDVNADNFYSPAAGDYPLIKGDQALYFIYNDATPNLHSGVSGFGLEIRCMAYAYGTCSVVASNPYLGYTTFYDYAIINRSSTTYNTAHFSLYTEADLGQFNDDYIGFDAQHGYAYIYNGDGNDETASGVMGYGVHPPAAGIVMLRGPVNTTDGIDNDADGMVDEPLEEMGLGSFTYYKNQFPGTSAGMGSPTTASEYMNYMTGLWKDGTPFTCDTQDGYGGTSATPYAFPGNTYTSTACPTGWQETQVPGDRRYVMSSGPKEIQPGEWVRLEFAHVTSFDSITNNPLQKLGQDISALKALYQNGLSNNCLATSLHEPQLQNQFRLYPNPAASVIYLDFKQQELVTVEVADVCGKVLLSAAFMGGEANSMDISALSSGVYLVKVSGQGGSSVKKLIRQ